MKTEDQIKVLAKLDERDISGCRATKRRDETVEQLWSIRSVLNTRDGKNTVAMDENGHAKASHCCGPWRELDEPERTLVLSLVHDLRDNRPPGELFDGNSMLKSKFKDDDVTRQQLVKLIALLMGTGTSNNGGKPEMVAKVDEVKS